MPNNSKDNYIMCIGHLKPNHKQMFVCYIHPRCEICYKYKYRNICNECSISFNQNIIGCKICKKYSYCTICSCCNKRKISIN
ncbi:hypothetical protein Yalta_013 [Yalta virus]|nr:hypothetical protein Yalta_013 [Yalta virus]